MSSGAMSRRKGQAAEREVAAALRRLGIEARTSRAATGGYQHGADIDAPSLPVDIEVKNGSRDELPRWLDQAVAQARAGRTPVVVHKRRGVAAAERWFATLRLVDLIQLIARTDER